jgi:hypothetical protein
VAEEEKMATERSIPVGQPGSGASREIGTPVDELNDDDLSDTGVQALYVRDDFPGGEDEDGEFDEIEGPVDFEDEDLKPLDELFV